MRHVILFSLCALLFGGCAHKHTISIPGQGSVTTSRQGSKTSTTIKTAQGKTATVTTRGNGNHTVYDAKGPNGSVHMEQNKGAIAMTMKSKKGTAHYSNTSKVEPSDFSVPFYPGAKIVPNKSSKTQLTDPKGQTTTMATVTLETSDAASKVAAFYASRMPGANKSETSADGIDTVMLMPGDKSKARRKTQVMIRQTKGGPTRVFLNSYSKSTR